MKTAQNGSETFGSLLQCLRRVAGLSQAELAERSGVSRRGIADLERGARRFPHPSTTQRLAAGLGLDARARADCHVLAMGRIQIISERAPLAGSLRVPHGPMIGRERELAEVQRLLKTERLLTLTGTGGSGKTRLALEAARATANNYADGVALVLLAPLTGPQLVLPAIADAVWVQERPGRSGRDALLAYLRSRRMLLLLDNFEHVLDAVPLVSDILAACPELSVLATSREALRLREEQEFPVAPLALPANLDGPVAALLHNPAVRLFGSRAAQTLPDFAVTPANARTVAAICTRLDGLPLAIELAAARIKVLSPTALLERLEHRLPLLVGGACDLPVRQRTLRAAIAWSNDLLNGRDQRLFQRLAVFSGSCTIEAAEALGACAPNPDHAVIDGLSSLVEKNLLQRDGC